VEEISMARTRRPAATRPHPAAEAVTPLPATRTMTVIAQDPSVRQRDGRRILMASIAIPAEALSAGPVGYRVQVVDYDASSRRFNGAHDLPATGDAEPRAWRAGEPRIVDDYRFHAQNVYALVTKTLARFEFALGRRVGWSFGTHQLKVAPHGLRDANAFYSPQEEGLVFGYFPGSRGGTVYTCLSHDVVVHETAHALIDALRERYMDPSSPDQAAFHEGLADVIALLSVFAQPEVLRELLRPPRSRRGSPAAIPRRAVTAPALRKSALFGLAEQMGREMQGARGDALRQSAQLEPDPGLLTRPEFLEPHRRGEVFVAAVINGFIAAWAARIERSSVPGQTSYPVARVAEEGADIADALATMWIRALDYMPPVHLEFPDALSAALTADLEVRPDDSRFELRRHVREAFRRHGIQPPATAERGTGTWQRAPGGLSYDRVRFDSMRTDRDEVFRFLWDNRTALELRPGAYTRVLSVRPCVRTGLDGFVLRETVAEYYQVASLTAAELRARGIPAPEAYLAALRGARRATTARPARASGPAAAEGGAEPAPDGDAGEDTATTPLHGGGVLIFDEYGRLKYHIHNDVFGQRRQGERLRYLWESGQLEAGRDGGRLRAARLSTIHRMRAIGARRFPAQGW
jgi:hypothetical protein